MEPLKHIEGNYCFVDTVVFGKVISDIIKIDKPKIRNYIYLAFGSANTYVKIFSESLESKTKPKNNTKSNTKAKNNS